MGHSPPHDSIDSFPANPMALWVSEPHAPGGGAWGGAWGGLTTSLRGQERDTNEWLTNEHFGQTAWGPNTAPPLINLPTWPSYVSSPWCPHLKTGGNQLFLTHSVVSVRLT